MIDGEDIWIDPPGCNLMRGVPPQVREHNDLYQVLRCKMKAAEHEVKRRMKQYEDAVNELKLVQADLLKLAEMLPEDPHEEDLDTIAEYICTLQDGRFWSREAQAFVAIDPITVLCDENNTLPL